MTRIAERTVDCSVCNTRQEERVLQSYSNFSGHGPRYFGLDFRHPAFMSYLRLFACECQHCGFVGDSVEKPLGVDVKFLESDQYRNFILPLASGLAVRFVRKAKIAGKKEAFKEAAFDYLCAAWVSDDANDGNAQMELRLLVLDIFEKLPEEEAKKARESRHVLRMDLLRRTGQFERVIEEYEGMHFEDGQYDRIRQFQISKAKIKDGTIYSMGDI